MIEVRNLCKSFGNFNALSDLNLHVNKGSVYGLIGINGSGKTTLIKHLTGILRQDSGTVLIDGQEVFDNVAVKEKTGYIPDDLYFFPGCSLRGMADFYKSVYRNWDENRFKEMLKRLNLPGKRPVARFSKGMQKQAAFILAMSAKPDYLILDEPIDGLDPIVRRTVWEYVVSDVAERQMTVLVSSHNLKEMEGICDSIGILSRGSMRIEKELDDLKGNIHKLQLAFSEGNWQEAFSRFTVLHHEIRGSVHLFIIKGDGEEINRAAQSLAPKLKDILPLSLEEVFIYEMGGEDNETKELLI